MFASKKDLAGEITNVKSIGKSKFSHYLKADVIILCVCVCVSWTPRRPTGKLRFTLSCCAQLPSSRPWYPPPSCWEEPLLLAHSPSLTRSCPLQSENFLVQGYEPSPGAAGGLWLSGAGIQIPSLLPKFRTIFKVIQAPESPLEYCLSVSCNQVVERGGCTSLTRLKGRLLRGLPSKTSACQSPPQSVFPEKPI